MNPTKTINNAGTSHRGFIPKNHTSARRCLPRNPRQPDAVCGLQKAINEIELLLPRAGQQLEKKDSPRAIHRVGVTGFEPVTSSV